MLAMRLDQELPTLPGRGVEKHVAEAHLECRVHVDLRLLHERQAAPALTREATMIGIICEMPAPTSDGRTRVPDPVSSSSRRTVEST